MVNAMINRNQVISAGVRSDRDTFSTIASVPHKIAVIMA
jgi:hypothetical protein